jgi:hypothetical protein
MVDRDDLGWFVGYKQRQKATAVNLVEWQDNAEVVDEFDSLNTLVVEGDKEEIRSLTNEWYITDVEREGTGQLL